MTSCGRPDISIIMQYAPKRRKTEIQKLKLAENMSSSKEFKNELKKINPVNKEIAYSVDNVIGDK